jgi:two-component system nitrate/nitrite response regulator NarL
MEILLVDDQPIICDALGKYLAEVGPECAETSVNVTSVHTLTNAIQRLLTAPKPDLVFLDLDLGNNEGASTLAEFQQNNSNNIPVVVFTGLPLGAAGTSATLRRCLYDLKAQTVMVKSTDLKTMLKGLPRILAGEKWLSNEVIDEIGRSDRSDLKLTPRQCQVLEALSRGLQNKEIAKELDLAPGTVQQITGAIYKRLGVHSRWAAAERFKIAGK